MEHRGLGGGAALAAAAAALVFFSAVCAGLTIAYMSLDELALEVRRRSGGAADRRRAAAVAPLLARPHLVLVSLLAWNCAAAEALPVVLQRLGLSPAATVALSVSAVLLFAEILPQAVAHSRALRVGAACAWFTWILIFVAAPVAWPLARLLDAALREGRPLFRRRELHALVSIHAEAPALADAGSTAGGAEPPLSADEAAAMQGALGLRDVTAAEVMTPLRRVAALAAERRVDAALRAEVLASGRSRLPVYAGGDRAAVVGLVLAKELLGAEEARGARVADLARRQPLRLAAGTRLWDALRLFRAGQSHLAVVVRPRRGEEPDAEAGGGEEGAALQAPLLEGSRGGGAGGGEVLGILTMEDALEALLGADIADETDPPARAASLRRGAAPAAAAPARAAAALAPPAPG